MFGNVLIKLTPVSCMILTIHSFTAERLIPPLKLVHYLSNLTLGFLLTDSTHSLTGMSQLTSGAL